MINAATVGAEIKLLRHNKCAAVLDPSMLTWRLEVLILTWRVFFFGKPSYTKHELSITFYDLPLLKFTSPDRQTDGQNVVHNGIQWRPRKSSGHRWSSWLLSAVDGRQWTRAQWSWWTKWWDDMRWTLSRSRDKQLQQQQQQQTPRCLSQLLVS